MINDPPIFKVKTKVKNNSVTSSALSDISIPNLVIIVGAF